MHCEQARDRLLEALDGGTTTDAELSGHLESCEACRALHEDLVDMQARARVWHDVPPPPWNARPGVPPAGGPVQRPGGWLAPAQQWFPVVASSAALILAVSIYWQSQVGPAPSRDAAALEGSSATEQLLAVSRREREEELEALTALLKAEMDRRSLETEQSLKYIISHQIQSQRQIDAMRGRLQQTPVSPGEQL